LSDKRVPDRRCVTTTNSREVSTSRTFELQFLS
jgi:hypothetical protein